MAAAKADHLKLWSVIFIALFFAGCARNKSVFFSKDLPEPLKARSNALTISEVEGDPPASFLYSSIDDNDLK